MVVLINGRKISTGGVTEKKKEEEAKPKPTKEAKVKSALGSSDPWYYTEEQVQKLEWKTGVFRKAYGFIGDDSKLLDGCWEELRSFMRSTDIPTEVFDTSNFGFNCPKFSKPFLNELLGYSTKYASQSGGKTLYKWIPFIQEFVLNYEEPELTLDKPKSKKSSLPGRSTRRPSRLGSTVPRNPPTLTESSDPHIRNQEETNAYLRTNPNILTELDRISDIEYHIDRIQRLATAGYISSGPYVSMMGALNTARARAISSTARERARAISFTEGTTSANATLNTFTITANIDNGITNITPIWNTGTPEPPQQRLDPVPPTNARLDQLREDLNGFVTDQEFDTITEHFRQQQGLVEEPAVNPQNTNNEIQAGLLENQFRIDQAMLREESIRRVAMQEEERLRAEENTRRISAMAADDFLNENDLDF